jgi:threonine dehydrogenase-like Zn-dependent dehydrogenase
MINGAGQVSVEEENLPALKTNEVLIKVHASLISPGTETGMVKKRRENPDMSIKPVAFGYANAGKIIEINGEAKGLKKGMRVAAMGAGYALHANYACVPVNMAVPIPDNVSYAQAAYACLGATALHGVRRVLPQIGEYGLVLGLGIVGNLTAQLCQLSGARLLVWETISSRKDIAGKCGIKNIINPKECDGVEAAKAFSAPYGVDFAVFAFGGEATDAFNMVMQCMKVSPDTHQMGRIVLVGATRISFGGGAASGNVDIRAASRTGPGYHDPAYEYGADYPNVFVDFTTRRNLREIIGLISEKRLLIDPVTTHAMALENAPEAVELLISQPDKALGIILEMQH